MRRVTTGLALAAATLLATMTAHAQSPVKIGMIMSYSGQFADTGAQIGNGASTVLGEIFGAAGRHARSAVGVAVLPMDAPVEVELVVQVRGRPRVVPA